MGSKGSVDGSLWLMAELAWQKQSLPASEPCGWRSAGRGWIGMSGEHRSGGRLDATLPVCAAATCRLSAAWRSAGENARLFARGARFARHVVPLDLAAD